MKILRIATLFLLLPGTGLLPGVAFAQAGPPRQQPPGPPEGRRDALEAMVLGRFVNRAGTELGLNPMQTRRLGETLKGSALQRRALNQRTMQLRRGLADAVRRPDTQESVFIELLTEQQRLRREEQRILEQEHAQLQQFLSPRQRAHFLLLWARLQDDARQVQARPGGGLPPDF